MNINLPDKIVSELFAATQEDGIPMESFVSQAIENHLSLRKFRTLRTKLMKDMDVQYTDQEIFDSVS
jgi:hypothetical protein